MSEQVEAPEQEHEEAETEEQVSEERTFSQDEVDRIVNQRAERKMRQSLGDLSLDELKAKAAQFDDIEDQRKTEAERAAEARQQAEAERDEARAESIRYKAAAKHQIGEDYYDLLGTGSEEQITARAELIGALLADRQELEQVKAERDNGSRQSASGRPVRDLRPGATPADTQSEDDVLYNQIYGGSHG